MEQTNDERRRIWVKVEGRYWAGGEVPPEGVKLVVTPSKRPTVVMVVEDYRRDEEKQVGARFVIDEAYWEVFPEEYETLKKLAPAEQAAGANEIASGPLAWRLSRAVGASFPVRTPKQMDEMGEADPEEFVRG